MAKRITFEAIKDPVQMIKLLNAMDTEIDALRTLVNELRTDHASMKSALDIFAGDYIVTAPGLGVGSTATDIASVAFSYVINGQLYHKAAVAAGTEPGTQEIPQTKYAAIALDIDAAGTITAVPAAANTTGYTSAALAIAGLPAVAANKARMGWVTVMKSDGAFTFGTTELSAANVTEVYVDAPGVFSVAGALSPATLAAAAVTEQVSKSL